MKGFIFETIIFILLLSSVEKIESKINDSSLLTHQFNSSCQKPSGRSICSINSIKHTKEYLFGSTNDYDKLYNHLFDMIPIRKVFMSNPKNLKSVSSKAQLLWILEPVDGMEDTFYLKSMSFKNERLCASHKHANILNLKRKVNLIKYTSKDKLNNSKCFWKIMATSTLGQKNDSTYCNYLIRNLFYKEFLFAATDFKDLKYRNVYTSFIGKKGEYSNNYVWRFDCKSIL
jgi:hypothetical protein